MREANRGLRWWLFIVKWNDCDQSRLGKRRILVWLRIWQQPEKQSCLGLSRFDGIITRALRGVIKSASRFFTLQLKPTTGIVGSLPRTVSMWTLINFESVSPLEKSLLTPRRLFTLSRPLRSKVPLCRASLSDGNGLLRCVNGKIWRVTVHALFRFLCGHRLLGRTKNSPPKTRRAVVFLASSQLTSACSVCPRRRWRAGCCLRCRWRRWRVRFRRRLRG